MAMSITRVLPLPTSLSLQKERKSIYDDFFQSSDQAEHGEWIPSLDVLESDNCMTIYAEVPGIDPKDIEVSVEKNTLTMKGVKNRESEAQGKSYCCKERQYGSFSRVLPLPPSIDTNTITAEYKNGVLKVALQKKEEIKPKKISVKST